MPTGSTACHDQIAFNFLFFMWHLLYDPAASLLSRKTMDRNKKKNSAHYYSMAGFLSTDDPLKFVSVWLHISRIVLKDNDARMSAKCILRRSLMFGWRIMFSSGAKIN